MQSIFNGDGLIAIIQRVCVQLEQEKLANVQNDMCNSSKLLDDCYMLDFCNLYAKLSKRDLLDILCYVTELTRLNILYNIKYIKLTDDQRMQAAQMAQDLYNHKPWSKIVGYKRFLRFAI